jgi:SNF2 family DNA or RNA helicase
MKLTRDDMHPYQLDALLWVLTREHAGLFLDMGLGKTITMLTAVADLLSQGYARKVLVIAPLRVCKTVWAEEAKKWDHTKNLTFSKILGSPAQRVAALRKRADVYLINAENVVWLTKHVGGENWHFDTVIFDESSLFKNPGSKRFRAAKAFIKKTQRTYILTGTPTPRCVHDLWAQLFLLDQGQRLFKTLSRFRDTFFDADFFGHTYTPKRGAQKRIQAKVADIVMSMRAEDYLDLPERIYNRVYVELPASAEQQYEELRSELLLLLEDDAVVEAANAGVLVNKCLQLTNGNLYLEDGGYRVIHDAKLKALEEIINSTGENILVFYQYKSDLAELQKRFPQGEVLRDDSVARWNKGDEIPLLMCHPASAGHGLNLQQGGHIMVFFGVNYNLETYQQSCARLHRQGQTKPVIIHHILADATIDDVVMTALEKKQNGQRNLLDSLKREL